MISNRKTVAPNIPLASVRALLSSLGKLARPSAPREARDTARKHLAAHLDELRQNTPRAIRHYAAAGAPKPAPARDDIDDLLDALATLSQPGFSPEAKRDALDKLAAHFDGLISSKEATAKEAASELASLNAKIKGLKTRVARAETASASRADVRTMQARAAGRVVDPRELATLGAIQRATQNTVGATARTKGGTETKPLTASQRAAIIAAGFDK